MKKFACMVDFEKTGDIYFTCMIDLAKDEPDIFKRCDCGYLEDREYIGEKTMCPFWREHV